MPKTTKRNPKTDEISANKEAEELASQPDEASAATINLDEEAEKQLVAEEATETEAELAPEVAAISEDNESASELNNKPAPAKSRRSPKHRSASELVEKGRLYPIKEAIELVKKVSYSKFDGSVELHLKLTKKKSKGGTESTRGVFYLPNGSGKDKKIAILDEALIETIAKTKKVEADVYIATPDLMPKVGKIAKILGPQGKMPDPKSGTVTSDPKKAIEEINSGKVDYRIDANNNIHQMVGKVSWEVDKLEENILAILSSMPSSKIAEAYLTATMAPAISLNLSATK